MYQVSTPRPFSKKMIDYLLEINKNIQKSRITSLYFGLPGDASDATGFEQSRFKIGYKTDFEYWKPLIEYSFEKGFDFIYLLNSPSISALETNNGKDALERLDKLINNLRGLGCNKLRICNPQLIEYLNQQYPDMNIHLSTSLEYQNIKQYSNLFSMFRNIKEFVPAFDLNKNFRFLKNIKSKFPDIEIELMVNEGCLAGCPIRNYHNLFLPVENKIDSEQIFNGAFFINKCRQQTKDLFFQICHPNIIYPWQLEEYSKIGINRFKLVGSNSFDFPKGKSLIYYGYYLKGVDNIDNILDVPIKKFNYYIAHSDFPYLIKDVKKYLPDIKQFVKKGHLCTSVCGVKCNYCYSCAQKLEKVLS